MLTASLSAIPASAQENASIPGEDLYNLESLSKQALTIDCLKENNSSFEVISDEVRLEVPKDSEGAILLSEAGEETISIQIPFADQSSDAIAGAYGEVSFNHENSASTSVLPYEDGSVQMVTTIEDSSAPREYVYDFGLPSDATLSLLEDGMVLVLDAEGEFLAGVAAPWAKDANGVDVPTRYEIRGSSLVQVVEHDIPGVSYPVTADPFWGKNLFTGFSRDWYKGDFRYNASVTSWGALVMSGGGGVGGYLIGQNIMRNQGWAEWTSRYPAITNKATLRHQYECHVAASTYGLPFAGAYNLERIRSNKPQW